MHSSRAWMLTAVWLAGPCPLQAAPPPPDEVTVSANDNFVAARAVEIASVTDLERSLDEAGFVPLFAGEGLQGWVAEDGRLSCWAREDQTISCVASGGGWLRTVNQYSDFILRLEYRLQAGSNSGIAVRSPLAAPQSGLEVQLIDDAAPKYAGLREDQYTGSIYYLAPPRQRAELLPVGSWNTCEIRCCSDDLRVTINGKVVSEIPLAAGRGLAGQDKRAYQLSQRPPVGHLALQSHSTRIDFRNLRLRDLTESAGEGVRIVDVLNGQGAAVEKTSRVSMHYVGQLAGGKRFLDTHDAGSPVSVELPRLVSGLRQGLLGMREGGRRRIVVQPEQGYGDRAAGAEVPAGSLLVYEVELLDVLTPQR